EIVRIVRGLELPARPRQRELREPHDEIAEIVSELAPVALFELIEGEIAVLAARERAQEIEAQRVDAPLLHDRDRIDDVAERLRHLPAIAIEDEAVDVDLPRKRISRGEKERRPDHRVEPEDVLSDDV